MDYTAIIVAFISLIGVIWQGAHNNKAIKKQDIKSELKEVRKQLDQVSAGQRYVLQDRLSYLCGKYINNGEIDKHDLRMITNMYNAYHDLGGNDFITELYERVKELPIKK